MVNFMDKEFFTTKKVKLFMRVISQMGNVKVPVDFSGTRGNYVIREISKPVCFPEKAIIWKIKLNRTMWFSKNPIPGNVF